MGPSGAETDEGRSRRKRRFFLIRVAILLFVLFVVVLYAVKDLRSRRARKDWDHTLDVAVVLVEVEGTPPAPKEAVQALADRAVVLEERLRAEADRHRTDALRPFRIKVHGPAPSASPPPEPSGDGPVDLARYTVELDRWLGAIDRSAGVEPSHWDTRIYVSIRKPATSTRSFVEGMSQQDGRVGFVSVELDESMVDTTLFVVTHELFHTLGATDKYDPNGRTKIPDGLAEPDRAPRYPQRFAEVMARNRPTSRATEVIPESLDELAVGAATAREIGWTRTP